MPEPFRKEFRRDVIAVAREGGRSAAEVARSFGISELYLCAVEDACSKRTVGYSIDTRMTFQLTVHALRNALILRTPDATAIVHSDRGSQF